MVMVLHPRKWGLSSEFWQALNYSSASRHRSNIKSNFGFSHKQVTFGKRSFRLSLHAYIVKQCSVKLLNKQHRELWANLGRESWSVEGDVQFISIALADTCLFRGFCLILPKAHTAHVLINPLVLCSQVPDEVRMLLHCKGKRFG